MIENLKLEILNTGHITNCYIIYNNSKEAIIIDPADKVEYINQKIEELDLKLKYVLLTHAHIDHILALSSLIDKFNIKVIVNINEKDMLESKIDNCARMFNIGNLEFDFNNFIFLKDGDILPIKDFNIKMVHTPGHTKGSSCYYIDNSDILITGDTLFSDSFGRYDLDSGNNEQLVESLVKIYKNYPNSRIFPGHGQYDVNLSDTYEKVRRLIKYTMKIDLEEFLN